MASPGSPRRLRCAIEVTHALDADVGIARYIRCLVAALGTLEVPAGEEFRLALLWRSSRWRRRLKKPFPRSRRVTGQMWRRGHWPPWRPYDVVHCPCDERMPPWPGLPFVGTIHDVYAAVGINFDDPHQRRQRAERYREIGQRCQRIICVSEYSRQDYLRLIGGDAERVHTIHPGVAPQFDPAAAGASAAVARKYGVGGRYLLYVGSATDNKNLPRLLRAYAASPARADFELVLAGKLWPTGPAPLLAQAEALGIGGRVRLPGGIDEADLPALYAGAAAFMFPSLYEGFGSPILEAMASGVPVLTSTVSACPEVAQGHAVLIDPLSVEELGQGIDRALRMPDDQRAAALRHARSKTYASTARQTLAIYRLAAGEGPRPGVL